MAWKLFTDGGSRGNPGPGASGAILYDENDKLLNFTGNFFAVTTNNNAEYDALYSGIKMALKTAQTAGIKDPELNCFLDSELAVKQMTGLYKISDSNIKSYKAKLDTLITSFHKVSFTHVPREQNKQADRLVNLILDTKLCHDL